MTDLTPSHTLDLEASGKQVGRVRFPLEQPWEGRDAIELPFCQISNGSGPTVVLLGGNHGDEYQGPLVLGRLIRELDPAAVQGRLLILPAMNLPSYLAKQRESPIDGLNTNRIWPGKPDGSISERIVHWIDSALLPHAQAFMDLHTGGKFMHLIPMSMTVYTTNNKQALAGREAAHAFNAPMNVEIRLDAQKATASWRASDRGLTVVGTETGGGAAIDPVTLSVCDRGVRNTLAHLGVLPEQPFPPGPHFETRFTRMWGFTKELTAPKAGVFVPLHDLWDEVEEGQPAGQLYDLEHPERAPELVRYPADGIIAGTRMHGGVVEGDVLHWLVQDEG